MTCSYVGVTCSYVGVTCSYVGVTCSYVGAGEYKPDPKVSFLQRLFLQDFDSCIVRIQKNCDFL